MTVQAGPAASDAALRDVSRAHQPVPYGRWLVRVLVALLAARVAWSLATNPNFDWHVVPQYFTAASILQGLSVTLSLTAVSMAIGIALGLLLAICRLSDSRMLQVASGLYLWFFRSTPLLVQLIFWYNLSTLFPEVSLGVPFGPTLVQWKTNDLITPLTAAIAGLALNEAAYMAEIIRGGLLSVDPGQTETATAFGMTRARALRRIIIPQAMRSIVPPTGNQVINLVKATALVSVIAMGELLYSVQAIYNQTFQVIPLLMVAVIWYLLITSVLNVGQYFIERHYGRGQRRTADATARKKAAPGPASLAQDTP